MCSTHPLIPLRKSFCSEGSITPLSIMYCFKRAERIACKSLPTAVVQAIGKKIYGLYKSPSCEWEVIRLYTRFLEVDGKTG